MVQPHFLLYAPVAELDVGGNLLEIIQRDFLFPIFFHREFQFAFEPNSWVTEVC